MHYWFYCTRGCSCTNHTLCVTDSVVQVGQYPRHLISLFFRLLYPWYWPSSCWNFVISCIRALLYSILRFLFSTWESLRRPKNPWIFTSLPIYKLELELHLKGQKFVSMERVTLHWVAVMVPATPFFFFVGLFLSLWTFSSQICVPRKCIGQVTGTMYIFFSQVF